MLIQFRSTVKVDEDGTIQTAKAIEVKNLTPEAAAMFGDLETLHSTFTRGVVSVITEESNDSDSNDDDIDLEEDDFDDDDIIEEDEDDVDGQ